MADDGELRRLLDHGGAIGSPERRRSENADHLHGNAQRGIARENGFVPGELINAGRDLNGVPAEVEAISARAGGVSQLHPGIVVEGVTEAQCAVGFEHWGQR